MKKISLLTQAGLGVGFLSTVLSVSALAQTPVSTSVQMSGSCPKCDLSHRDMERMSLQGSNFSGSNFSHSNLSGGKFYQSNLAGASFSKAYMMRIEGDGVILHKSNLRDATLSEATLTNSDISYADLRRSDLRNGNFHGSSFQGSILKASDAMEANFQGVNFRGAYLTHGNFTNANFSDANLSKAVFGNAILTECNFKNANLSGADMINVTGLKQSQLDQACGDESTVLPEGYSITNCPSANQAQVTQEAAAYQDTYTVVPTPPASPRTVNPYVLRTEPDVVAPQQAASNHDIAIDLIEQTLRSLPMDSPSRARLEAAISHIEMERAASK
ncbi:MAG: pentapeptide repeat-containing protein [Hyphomonadaceae bacterium]|nr:pentapeptide repeat-containing protein [Hyphomonadaceae bacterium]